MVISQLFATIAAAIPNVQYLWATPKDANQQVMFDTIGTDVLIIADAGTYRKRAQGKFAANVTHTITVYFLVKQAAMDDTGNSIYTAALEPCDDALQEFAGGIVYDAEVIESARDFTYEASPVYNFLDTDMAGLRVDFVIPTAAESYCPLPD